jgi:hypothetical protein
MHIFENDKLEVAKWLLEIHPDFVNFVNEEIFITACQINNLEMAQWLLNIKPTIENVNAFRISCMKGNLQIAKWLERVAPQKYKIVSYTLNPIQIKYRIKFLKINGTKYTTILEQCPICMETLCQVISICNHSYCENCIETHLVTKDSCPICRKKIRNEMFQNIQCL